MTKQTDLAALAADLGDLELLVAAFQRSVGLDADGWPGAKTRAAIDALGGDPGDVPIPRTRAEIKDVYGDFAWTPGRGRSVDIDDDWEDLNIRSFTLHTGQRRRLHRLVGAEFVELFERACELSGYTPKSVQTYNPRRIKPDRRSPLSMHSWGIAVDFDPNLNRWGGKLKNGARCPLAKHPEFLQVFRDAGWTCGADWRQGGGDWMHIERRAPRR